VQYEHEKHTRKVGQDTIHLKPDQTNFKAGTNPKRSAIPSSTGPRPF